MIELRNLTLSYGDHTVLENCSGSIKRGSFTCVLGKNGCGKSTLLKAMAGLLVPAKGNVLLKGAAMVGMYPALRARMVAYFPQSRPLPQTDALTMIRHGRFPHLGFSKILQPADHAMIDRAVAFTDTETLLDKDIRQLSGGERQRVYLAMMVAQDAEVLLLDEPATFLDVDYQLDIMRMISKLNGDGKTVVMVAHDIAQAVSAATDILLVHDADIACGSRNEMIQSGLLERVFGVGVQQDTSSLYGYKLTGGSAV
ncbi:ABC transporter ATP-binding protein [Christensenellaceae bacterium OttesenSCG-928-K19]|nr:ABC transporter ATP-binding protein [Christensenellaceae bacterium OttesenSCG-928-K19]